MPSDSLSRLRRSAQRFGGFAETHAPAIGIASIVEADKISASAAGLAVLAALSANTVSKLALAFIGGGRPFLLRVGLGLLVVIAAAWLGLVVSQV
jgi:uncharacterized membrane protein (DUF4010 family)